MYGLNFGGAAIGVYVLMLMDATWYTWIFCALVALISHMITVNRTKGKKDYADPS
jgi:Mn2+/Fe2+ NRAMP family transporter